MKRHPHSPHCVIDRPRPSVTQVVTAAVGEAWIASTLNSMLMGFAGFDIILIVIESFVAAFAPVWVMKSYLAVAFALGAEG